MKIQTLTCTQKFVKESAIRVFSSPVRRLLPSYGCWFLKWPTPAPHRFGSMGSVGAPCWKGASLPSCNGTQTVPSWSFRWASFCSLFLLDWLLFKNGCWKVPFCLWLSLSRKVRYCDIFISAVLVTELQEFIWTFCLFVPVKANEKTND